MEGLPTKFYKREVPKSVRAWPTAVLRTIAAVRLYDTLARVLARRRSFWHLVEAVTELRN